jgi:ribonuclease HI
MPWIEATLRGQRVLARAKADGALEVKGGRVEIRYGRGAGRSYRAAAGNLEVAAGAKLHGDDVCQADRLDPPTRQSRHAPGGAAALVPPIPADAWIAYTDGACSGNPGPAGYGVVIVSPDGATHEGLEYIGEATNNVAELMAILRAVEWMPGHARTIVVHTDSQYAIGVLQRGWKAKANQELVARTKRVVETRSARLVYVPGHRGVPLNERADALAREAIQIRDRRVAPMMSG